MRSIWEETVEKSAFPALDRDITTDVLIIGGGMCGLLCAWQLHQAGIDYVLVEADTICSGTTGKTTAKITVQHGLIYQKLIKTFGAEAAKQYLRANKEALKRYVSLCQKIDCDFAFRDSFVYSRNSQEKIQKEIAALKKLGMHADLCTDLPLPFPTTGAIRLEGQAQFHPLKFVSAISRGLHTYEHTKVQEWAGTKVITNGGSIQAKRILVTTHFPIFNKHGSYFLKLYQHRSYVIALKNAPQLDGMYVDEAQTGMSFRNDRDILFLGGGGHRTGKQGGGWEELRAFAQKHYPNAEECGHWATQDCMSLDAVPYIGPYAKGTEGIYVATGFNKWGMTTSMAAAMLLSDWVQGKENPNAAIFSPSRSILHPQLGLNAVEAAVSLLAPGKKRCPHMGCVLKWNPQEHTWDCPCHGSRFTAEGELIDNPATDDLSS